MNNKSKKCQNCGESLTPGARFCESCGHEASMVSNRGWKIPVFHKTQINYAMIILAILVIISISIVFGFRLIYVSDTSSEKMMTECEKLMNESRYFEAVKCCDRIIDSNPSSELAYLDKGKSLSMITKDEIKEEAIQCFEDAYKINGSNKEALFQAGMTKYDMQDYRGAIVYLEKLGNESKNSRIRYALAECYKHVNELGEK